MIKAVVDTSVFIAALLSRNAISRPRQVLDAWQDGRFSLVMSPQLLEELVTRLQQNSHYRQTSSCKTCGGWPAALVAIGAKTWFPLRG